MTERTPPTEKQILNGIVVIMILGVVGVIGVIVTVIHFIAKFW